MNVCRVQLKGIKAAPAALAVVVIDSTNIAVINWKSHVFIHCPLFTTIFPFAVHILCSKLHKFSWLSQFTSVLLTILQSNMIANQFKQR